MPYDRVSNPEYTIYYSFINLALDKYGLSKLPIRQRPTACVLECSDEKDMRSKYAYIINLFASELDKMEIRVYKER